MSVFSDTHIAKHNIEMCFSQVLLPEQEKYLSTVKLKCIIQHIADYINHVSYKTCLQYSDSYLFVIEYR